MGLRIAILATTMLTFASCAGRRSSTEEANVRAAWAEFKRAELSGKGDTVANRVTRATLDHYDEIRRLALSGTREELNRVTLAIRLIALMVRLRVPASALQNMSGRDLLVYAVDQGWIGKNGVTDQDIGEIVVNGDHARAMITNAGKPANQYIHFMKQGDEWRLDLMPLMALANMAFDRAIKRSGLTEEQFIKQSLEAITSRVVTEELWTPPIPESP